MGDKRRAFSAEEKVSILRRHLVDKVPVSNLCDEYGMNPTALYRWQKEFFENGAAAFERCSNRRERKLEERVEALTAKLAQFYPQSNGKQERWYATLKRECIRPGTPLSLEYARRIVADFVVYYNERRLHSAIGYIAPKDKLAGRAEAILAEREVKLAAARQARKNRRQGETLTERREEPILHLVGETDASSAGGQLARDSRPGGDEYRPGAADRSLAHFVSVG